MIHKIFQIYSYVLPLAGIWFIFRRNLTGSLIVYFLAIPFENAIQVIPSVSLLKVMSIITFLSFMSRKDFIPFFLKKIVMNRFVIIFAALFIICTILCVDKMSAKDEATRWIQILMLFGVISYFSDRMPGALEKIDKILIFYGLCIIGAMFLIYGLSFTRRLFLSRFLGPNNIAIIFTGFSILLYGRKKLFSNLKFYIMMAMFVISIFLTGNRSIPLGFLSFLFFSFFIRSKINKVRLIAIVTAAVLVVTFAPTTKSGLFYHTRARIFSIALQLKYVLFEEDAMFSLIGGQYHSDHFRSYDIKNDVRIKFYDKLTKQALKENLFFGSGPGSSSNIIKRIFEMEKNAHSNIIAILLDYGVVGLCLFLYMIFILYKSAYTSRSSLPAVQLIMLLTIFFVDGLAHTNYKDFSAILFIALIGFRINSVKKYDKVIYSESKSLDELRNIYPKAKLHVNVSSKSS